MIASEVASAFRRARGGKSVAEFAREINGLLPYGPQLDAADLELIERETDVWSGGMPWPVAAVHLVAAARLAEQPVSSLLGEQELYETTIPMLERELARLAALVEQKQLKDRSQVA